MNNYFQLMRLHKPIGILLLLWPTLWALFIAANDFPSIKNIFIFVFGVILMRSAGCVINDIADRNFDAHVARTKSRPITAKKIKPKNAFILFIFLCTAAFFLVLFTNKLTILLSFVAVIIAIIYPFMKRYTYWPQLVLGIAFSFSIPMAFAAEINYIPSVALLMMLINILWTILYDTEYAMIDRADDITIGIKSTAILFGKFDRVMIGCLQCSVIILLFFLGFMLSLSYIYFCSIFVCILLFAYQQTLMTKHEPEKCMCAFLNNQWIGLLVFLGIVI